jgi:hypothetical protein
VPPFVSRVLPVAPSLQAVAQTEVSSSSLHRPVLWSGCSAFGLSLEGVALSAELPQVLLWTMPYESSPTDCCADGLTSLGSMLGAGIAGFNSAYPDLLTQGQWLSHFTRPPCGPLLAGQGWVGGT